MDLDLRDADTESYYERIANALQSSAPLQLVAGADPTVSLRRYEIEHREQLRWAVDADGDSWRVTVERGGELDDSCPDFDVRSIPPQRRHTVLTGTFDGLTPGEGFVLVNDHDPKPLYHQFEAEAGPEFHWAYEHDQPGEFRVLIGKADTEAGATPAQTQHAPF